MWKNLFHSSLRKILKPHAPLSQAWVARPTGSKLFELFLLKGEGAGMELLPTYKIESQEILAPLAIWCTENYPSRTALHFPLSLLENEEERFHLAVLCAKRQGEATAASIERFHLTSPQARYEVALASVRSGGHGFVDLLSVTSPRPEQSLEPLLLSLADTLGLEMFG